MVCVVGYGGVWRRGVMGSVGMGGGDWGEENRRGVSILDWSWAGEGTSQRRSGADKPSRCREEEHRLMPKSSDRKHRAMPRKHFRDGSAGHLQ